MNDCRSEGTCALETRRGIFEIFHNFVGQSMIRAQYTAFLIYLPFKMERLCLSANSFNHFLSNLHQYVDSCVFAVTKDGRPLYQTKLYISLGIGTHFVGLLAGLVSYECITGSAYVNSMTVLSCVLCSCGRLCGILLP